MIWSRQAGFCVLPWKCNFSTKWLPLLFPCLYVNLFSQEFWWIMKPAPFFIIENRWVYWLSSHERNCRCVQWSFPSWRVCHDIGKFCCLWSCPAGYHLCWDGQFFPSSGHMAVRVDMTTSVSSFVCSLGPCDFVSQVTHLLFSRPWMVCLSLNTELFSLLLDRLPSTLFGTHCAL